MTDTVQTATELLAGVVPGTKKSYGPQKLRDFMLSAVAPEPVDITIAGGVIDVTGLPNFSTIRLHSEVTDSPDQLDTIEGGRAGMVLLFNSAENITFSIDNNLTWNEYARGSTDAPIMGVDMPTAIAQYVETSWNVISGTLTSNGVFGPAVAALLGLMSGADDPSAGIGIPAALGTIYRQTSDPAVLWYKTGDADTAWASVVS